MSISDWQEKFNSNFPRGKGNKIFASSYRSLSDHRIPRYPGRFNVYHCQRSPLTGVDWDGRCVFSLLLLLSGYLVSKLRSHKNVVLTQFLSEDSDIPGLTLSPEMRCGTGGTVERPLPTESTFAAATRIFKHAVAAKYFEDGILDTWICVSTALAAEAWSLLWNRLFLQVIARGPMMHEKCLWRFYPVVVSLVYQNKRGVTGKGTVCRGWEVEVD